MPEPSTGSSQPTPGALLANRLADARRKFKLVLRPGARALPYIEGVTQSGRYFQPSENVILQGGEILAESRKVFRFSGDIVYETESGANGSLQLLMSGARSEQPAVSLLANLLYVRETKIDKSGECEVIEFPIPKQVVEQTLNSAPVRKMLPEVKTYLRRPAFSPMWEFYGPGWHEKPQILIHSMEVEPVLAAEPGGRDAGFDTLPKHLKAVLGEFVFKDESDLANAVAFFLTGALANMFVGSGKPLALVEGNQPNIGKTLLVRALGVILDGREPVATSFTVDDDELAKRMCASVRNPGSSVLLIDNAKLAKGEVLTSAIIEANSLAPEVNLRILGKSEYVRRPNDILWAITVNRASASSDMISRSLPVRMHYEGDPQKRKFANADLIEYAMRYRKEILGELFGLVIRWIQNGKPKAERAHRCGPWSQIVGGILSVAGVHGFLANIDEARESFSVDSDDLSALAEVAIRHGPPAVVETKDSPGSVAGDAKGEPEPGLQAMDWVALFFNADILQGKLSGAKSARARSTLVGNFFSTNLERCVAVTTSGVSGRATLKKRMEAGNKTLYFFELRMDLPIPKPHQEDQKIQDTSMFGDPDPSKHLEARKGGSVTKASAQTAAKKKEAEPGLW